VLNGKLTQYIDDAENIRTFNSDDSVLFTASQFGCDIF